MSESGATDASIVIGAMSDASSDRTVLGNRGGYEDVVVDIPTIKDCAVESWDIAYGGLTLSIIGDLGPAEGGTTWIRTGVAIRDTDIHEVHVIGIAGWLTATGARIVTNEFDRYDGTINVLIDTRLGSIPAEPGKGAIRVIVKRRASVLRPKIKGPGMSERVTETRSGSSKRSTREARRELLPAMPAVTPENSEEEEMDAGNTPRYKRAIPNEKRPNRRLRCRVCRENPARGATVPCLTLATATLCVACFMDRHPQYVDSVVKVMVVDMKGERGMNENGDVVAGEIVSETVVDPRESPREHGRCTSPKNEKKAFANGFSNKSFDGKNLSKCVTEDFTKFEDGSQCSEGNEARSDNESLHAQPAALATCSVVNTPLGGLDENDERDLVVFAT